MSDELTAQAVEKWVLLFLWCRSVFIHSLPIFSDPNYEERLVKIKAANEIDAKYGYENYTLPHERVSWLVNIAVVSRLLLPSLFCARTERKSDQIQKVFSWNQCGKTHKVVEYRIFKVCLFQAEMVDEHSKVILSAVDFYFLEESGKRLKVSRISLWNTVFNVFK